MLALYEVSGALLTREVGLAKSTVAHIRVFCRDVVLEFLPVLQRLTELNVRRSRGILFNVLSRLWGTSVWVA